MDGDGDITRPENITAFRNFVLESTERRGMHFLMADGVRLIHMSILVCTAGFICSYSSAAKYLRYTYQAEDKVTKSCSLGFLLLIGSLLVSSLTVSGRVSLWKARKTSRRS